MKTILLLLFVSLFTSCAGMQYRGNGHFNENGEYIKYKQPKSKNIFKPFFQGKKGSYVYKNGDYVFVEDTRPSIFEQFGKIQWTPIWMERK